MPEMFGAKFPLPVLNEKISFSSGAIAIAAGSTNYLGCADQGGEGMALYNATETVVAVNYLVTRLGTIKNLVVYGTNGPGVGQTYTFVVRINGAPTAITCVVSGGNLGASDLVNTVKVVVGDRITIQIVTSAGAATIRCSATIFMETPSTRKPYERTTFTSYALTIAANLTRVLASMHRAPSQGGIATETYFSCGYLATRKGTLKNLVVLVGAAPGAGETFVYTVRVNAINTAMTVTLSGAAQLTGTDLVNVVQIDPGDRITLQVVTSLAAAATTHAASFDFEEGDYRAG